MNVNQLKKWCNRQIDNGKGEQSVRIKQYDPMSNSPRFCYKPLVNIEEIKIHLDDYYKEDAFSFESSY